MVSKLHANVFQVKLFEKFYNRVKSDCNSHKQFKKRFKKLTPKLLRRAQETGDYLRVAMLEDTILASIISYGKLNEETSNYHLPMQLAIDAIISKIDYVNPYTRSKVTEEDICVRVVVQDSGINLIISAYPDRKNEFSKTDIPKVPLDRWE